MFTVVIQSGMSSDRIVEATARRRKEIYKINNMIKENRMEAS